MYLKLLKDTPPWDWPKDAGKMFLEILNSNQADESDRLLTAELAGDFTVINDELVDALLSILRNRDEPELLQGKAAISLGPVLEHAHINGFEDPDDVPINEQTFLKTQELLHKLYTDDNVPKNVRRRILEAAVRAPQDWHRDAIRVAYSSDDGDWRLTAVFCMCFIRGFDDQILEALGSENPDIHYQAVCAAGNWEVDAVWSHITGLVTSEDTDKTLFLAAIDALGSIRPQEAGDILFDLTKSDDEDIVDAAYEAMAMTEGLLDEDYDDEEDGFILSTAIVEVHRMAKKKKKLNQKMQVWIDDRKRHNLSHIQIQMARELGMNPKKLNKLNNHNQEPWKMLLQQYIEHL